MTGLRDPYFIATMEMVYVEPLQDADHKEAEHNSPTRDMMDIELRREDERELITEIIALLSHRLSLLNRKAGQRVGDTGAEKARRMFGHPPHPQVPLVIGRDSNLKTDAERGIKLPPYEPTDLQPEAVRPERITSREDMFPPPVTGDEVEIATDLSDTPRMCSHIECIPGKCTFPKS